MTDHKSLIAEYKLLQSRLDQLSDDMADALAQAARQLVLDDDMTAEALDAHEALESGPYDGTGPVQPTAIARRIARRVVVLLMEQGEHTRLEWRPFEAPDSDPSTGPGMGLDSGGVQ